MKKIKLLTIISIVLVVSIVLGGSILFSQYQTKSITSFIDNDKSKINKIDIMNGNNGEIVSVDNKQVISDISAYLSKLKLKKISPPPSTGWTYRFSINENDKEILNITFKSDKECEINDSKYKIEKSTDVTVDKLYDEAKKSGK
jgi:cell division protein YceG involved in septum cleavage